MWKNVQFYLWQMEVQNNEGGLGRCGVLIKHEEVDDIQNIRLYHSCLAE